VDIDPFTDKPKVAVNRHAIACGLLPSWYRDADYRILGMIAQAEFLDGPDAREAQIRLDVARHALADAMIVVNRIIQAS
jgi:hypothetical protein